MSIIQSLEPRPKLANLLPTKEVFALNVKVGDQIQSSTTGKIMSITHVKKTATRIEMLFDGDKEIDMGHYHPIMILKKE